MGEEEKKGEEVKEGEEKEVEERKEEVDVNEMEKEVKKEEKEKKVFKCKYCGAEFEKAILLAGHVRKEHRKEKEKEEKVREVREEVSVPVSVQVPSAGAQASGASVSQGKVVSTGGEVMQEKPSQAMLLEEARRRAEAVRDKYKRLLLSYSGVTGVGVVDMGNGQYGIGITVEKLTEDVKAAIPPTLDGIPVRVEERTVPKVTPKDRFVLNCKSLDCAQARIRAIPSFEGVKFKEDKVILNGRVVGTIKADEQGILWYHPVKRVGPLYALLERMAKAESWGIFFEGPVRRRIRERFQEWWHEKVEKEEKT
ncbi:MAG: hypothetical protein ACXQTS_04010 [Candidatus Methanospirareceae archaeon]